jgi:hypothetical protein
VKKMALITEFKVHDGERVAKILGGGDPSASDLVNHLIAWSGEQADRARAVTVNRRAATRNATMELLS